ncbi:hypothetical protein QFC19_001313 [Naganishia cerealis]|uniref:Uncharacterized protein n=1 Tax=Naganishia cerealis TaxID=610337 RepID=A0ACC2WH44_9TREE|nr:hypothetical protein QFC19_001313 [Naganishia cerealis]
MLLSAFTTLSVLATLSSLPVALGGDAWADTYGGYPDPAFAGVATFAHLDHQRCLDNPDLPLDLAIIGIPYDSAVTFRPDELGARFGPYGLRSGSRRQATARGYSQTLGINPYDGKLSVLDCGDVPVIPNDPAVAIDQVRAAYSSLLSRNVVSPGRMNDLGYAKGLDGKFHPRMVTLGGDHTIGPADLDDDVTAGFQLIHAFDIDDLGVPEVVRRIKQRIGDSPVVISLDVDVMDPSTAPATGTPESGGWTSRELRRIIQSLQGLNVVAFDIVELSPAYDTNAEISAIAAADCAYDFLCLYALGTDAKLVGEEEDLVIQSSSHQEL